MRWLGNSDIIRQIQAADPAAGEIFRSGDAFTLGSPQNWQPSPAIPVARYRSLAAFQADVTNYAIGLGYRWVLYDPENWPDTPPEEQADPWTWLPRFGQYAHAKGYRVICAPARDLGNVKDTVEPRKFDESLNTWYERTFIAGTAAVHADIIDVQAQALTEDVGAYSGFVQMASAQARSANPYVKVLAGVSTRYGAAAQMAAAARSVHVDGFWLNCPGPDPDIGKACEWLRLMTGGTA